VILLIDGPSTTLTKPGKLILTKRPIMILKNEPLPQDQLLSGVRQADNEDECGPAFRRTGFHPKAAFSNARWASKHSRLGVLDVLHHDALRCQGPLHRYELTVRIAYGSHHQVGVSWRTQGVRPCQLRPPVA
jgi:hypothetical protein